MIFNARIQLLAMALNNLGVGLILAGALALCTVTREGRADGTIFMMSAALFDR